MEAITGFSEIISIRYKQRTREFDKGGCGRENAISKFTPSLMQKRRLLKPPQEISPVFESIGCVVPALLTAPQARISDAELVSMVKAGDLPGLDELFRTHQASPLHILENEGTLLQVSYPCGINSLRFLSYKF